MEVRDLMSTDVIAVGPKTSIRDAARLMFRYQVSGVPVVDVDDHLLGIVTEGDFLRMEIERLESGNIPEDVASVMTKTVKTIPPDMDVTGAGSHAGDLEWFHDRIEEALPRPVVISISPVAPRSSMPAFCGTA